jgi:tRNA-Thr(GGU) m(6)t(6)A37 methyltransferase TsaA
MNIEPIGYIESCYRDKFGTPRQSGLVSASVAKLRILPHIQPEFALQGLEEFSHLWLIWGFHKNENRRYHPKTHPPRLGGKSMGVFATRTPHRPNPLGLSLVEIDRIDTPELFLKGIDLISGTPIYDIKPYLPQTESYPEAKAGWPETVADQSIEVIFKPECLIFLRAWREQNPGVEIEKMIEQTISLDPRPVVYRGFEGLETAPYRQKHVFALFDLDIEFEFLETKRAQVQLVRPRI